MSERITARRFAPQHGPADRWGQAFKGLADCLHETNNYLFSMGVSCGPCPYCRRQDLLACTSHITHISGALSCSQGDKGCYISHPVDTICNGKAGFTIGKCGARVVIATALSLYETFSFPSYHMSQNFCKGSAGVH